MEFSEFNLWQWDIKVSIDVLALDGKLLLMSAKSRDGEDQFSATYDGSAAKAAGNCL